MLSLHIDTARGWRGGQSQVRYTVLGLRQRGDRAVLVAHPEGELLKRMSEGTDLIPLAPRHEVDLAAAWRFSKVLRQYAPDVIQAHDPHGMAMAATALAIVSNGRRPPLVATRRVDFHVARNSFSRWKYSQVDCFVAITNAIADMLVGDGIPRHKIALVNEGVDVERIVALPVADVHEECYLPVGSPVVGNVAALVPHKGQHYLIEAAALVVREVPDVRFVILGDGELREQLEREIKQKHLERHVFLAGFRSNALELIKSFDVFVMSSITEGLCTSIVDAMAASKCVVATEAGGIPEVVAHDQTGFLVPVRDPKALAERLVQVLKDEPLRRRMGEAGLARARARFTVERMVEETNAVYERLVDTRREAGTARRAARD
jgi:glycosyltransferase involved in cell wall biosynthesis